MSGEYLTRDPYGTPANRAEIHAKAWLEQHVGEVGVATMRSLAAEFKAYAMYPNPATPAPSIRLPARFVYVERFDEYRILDADGRVFATIEWRTDHPSAKANAMVKSLNAQPQHDELVKWLGIMIQKFECCARVGGTDQEYVDIATADARAALATAKEHT